MIEIFLIWKMVVVIGKSAADKSLLKFRYQLMAVLLWISFEITGVLIGTILFGNYGSKWPIYIIGIIGGFLGAGLSFLILRLIPSEDINSQISGSKDIDETSNADRFSRTIWIPIITIIIAISCLLLSFGGALISQMFESAYQIEVTNPIIGIDLDESGNIVPYNREIPAETGNVFFGFDIYVPRNRNITLTFDWYIDGHIAYSFSRQSENGQTIVSLGKREIGSSLFISGNYEVFVYFGEMLLTSSSFTIK